MEAGNFVFEWKGCIFATFLEGSILKLRWTEAEDIIVEDTVQMNRNSLSPANSPFEVIEDASAIFGNEEDHQSSKFKNSSLDLGEQNHLEILTVGYSFDSVCLCKVPVILLQCSCRSKQKFDSNSKKRKKAELQDLNLNFILVRLTVFATSRSKAMYDEQLLSSQRKRQSVTQNFTLVCVRKYPTDFCFHACNHKNISRQVGFAANFQMVLLDRETVSMWIFYKDKVSNKISTQHFKLDNMRTLTDIHLLDIFINEGDGIFFTLISAVTDGETQVFCLKFSLIEFANFSSRMDMKSEMFDMTFVPLEILFTPDFSKITKAVQITSISCYDNEVTKAEVFTSAVTVITTTGFALRFINGAMQSCVNVIDNLGISWSEDDWDKVSIYLVNCMGRKYEKTAIHVESLCCLVNWRNNEVEKVWPSIILTSSSCAFKGYGVPVLVLVQHFENNNAGPSLQLDGAKCIVHDFDEESHSDSGRSCMRMRSGLQEDDEMDNVDLLEQPHCAVSALLSQKQRCESAVRQEELTVTNKKLFFMDTWQQLAGNLCSTDGSYCPTNSQSPLVPLIEGTMPVSSCDQDSNCGPPISSFGSPRKFVETHGMWKKTVDSLLIVGLTVKNICKSPITDMYLSLVPSTPCAENIFHSSSKCGLDSLSSNTSARQHTTLCNKVAGHNPTNKRYVVQPGSDTVLSACTDTMQAISGRESIFHVFLTFTLIDIDLMTERKDKEEFLWNTKNVEEYCGEVVLTFQDVFAGAFSVWTDPGVDATIDQTSLMALDCVQTGSSLVIQSVVTSINCLIVKLTSHSSFRHIEWPKQYIFMASHQLKFCRVCFSEPDSKHHGKLKIFGRSEHQKLLFVKFLYSLLPEDVTIVPEFPSPSFALQQAVATSLEEINHSLCAVRLQLETLTTGGSSILCAEEELQMESPGSPKFGSSKVRRTQVKLAGKQKHEAGPEMLPKAAEASGSTFRLKEENGFDENVTKEKVEVKGKRKRLREKWGDEEEGS